MRHKFITVYIVVPVIVSNSFLLDKMEYNIRCVRCVLIFINISRNELIVCCVCYYWMKRKKIPMAWTKPSNQIFWWKLHNNASTFFHSHILLNRNDFRSILMCHIKREKSHSNRIKEWLVQSCQVTMLRTTKKVLPFEHFKRSNSQIESWLFIIFLHISFWYRNPTLLCKSRCCGCQPYIHNYPSIKMSLYAFRMTIANWWVP